MNKSTLIAGILIIGISSMLIYDNVYTKKPHCGENHTGHHETINGVKYFIGDEINHGVPLVIVCK